MEWKQPTQGRMREKLKIMSENDIAETRERAVCNGLTDLPIVKSLRKGFLGFPHIGLSWGPIGFARNNILNLKKKKKF